MRWKLRAVVVVASALLVLAVPTGWGLIATRPVPVTPVATSSLELELTPVATGLDGPVYVTHAGDGSGRLFVVGQAGTIHIVKDGALLLEPFLDIRELVITDNWEQGLFSVAFHPDFETNGRFFVDYTARDDGRTVVAEYRVSDDPDKALPEGRTILTVPQPTPLHNGGQLHFGPDGYLYISVGDGVTLPGLFPNYPQDLGSLLGKLLRIDVNNGDPYAIPPDNPFVGVRGARPEVWAYGLRNPWRFSFDRATGRLFAGDVGEQLREEIDLIEKGGNYGWSVREGSNCHVETVRGRLGCWWYSLNRSFIPPLVEYTHLPADPQGGNSIIGGYVYRGTRYPELSGVYLFGDFVAGRIWALREQPDGRRMELLLDTDMFLASFGEDEAGELYVTDRKGGVYRLGVAEAAGGTPAQGL